MTKWILLLVVLANGLAYFWFSAQQAQRAGVADSARVPSLVPEGGSTLALLSERDGIAPPEPPSGDTSTAIADTVDHRSSVPGLSIPAPGSALAGVADVSPGTTDLSGEESVSAVASPDADSIDGADADGGQCLLVGPFAQRQEVDNLVFKLGTLSVDAAVKSREEEVSSSSFWVYLPPLLSEKAAARKLQELKNSGVDSFIFQDGELKNGISLGFFAARENALKRQQELAKAGYKTRIFSAPDLVRTFWVQMPTAAQRALAESFWKELGASNPAIKLERDNCG